MCTKEWLYQSNNENYQFGLYQELSVSDENNNGATILIQNPLDFSVSYRTNDDNSTFGDIMAEIPVEEFDRIAMAWCKYRKLKA
jgi:hypothetical protein